MKIIMLQVLCFSRPFRWFLVDHEKIAIPPSWPRRWWTHTHIRDHK
jgi:hypothetical protein